MRDHLTIPWQPWIAAGVLAIISAAASSDALAAPLSRNAVLLWNQAALDTIQVTRTPPPVAARALAIVHTCMFDAWAAYDAAAVATTAGLIPRRPTSDRTQINKQIAISFAAYRALADLFPTQTLMKFDPLMSALGFDSSNDSSDLQTPAGIGNAACKAVLDNRHKDGSNQLGNLHPGTYSDYSGFTPVNTSQMLRDPNRWQPLIVNGVPQRWLLPQWGLVAPFAPSASRFSKEAFDAGPFLYPSLDFLKQVLDVVELSAHLGDREKAIAEYWADGFTTVTPPGHWCLFAQQVSMRDHHTLDQDLKMFFILANALMDASIAAWDVKRCADSVRPITAIRVFLSNRPIHAWSGPGLGVREMYGRDFRSYLPTPAFGSYPSGHSTLSAAASEVLKRFTGSDDFGGSETVLPGTSLVEPGLTPSAPIVLSWKTFADAADEAGMSRRYGGIHYEMDDLAGRVLGRRVADEVWAKAASYIQGNVN